MKSVRADVAENLGCLFSIRMHCSNLAGDALHDAIKDYPKKKEAKKWFWSIFVDLNYFT